MDRRKFLIGAGSAAVGGSALLGSGAFTRVESQRSVTVQVAEDPSAYLGMDKCPDSPNASYASLDDNGHLQVLMNPENPTIGDSPLGDGINSDSSTWFDNVFQLCNQGKEDTCIYIEDNENWPTVPEGETQAGERRVDFYLGADAETSIIGEENAVPLPLGECVCVGIRTRSYGLSDGDELLAALDNEIRIVADVTLNCTPDPEEVCDIYGIDQQFEEPQARPITTGAGVGPGVAPGPGVQDLTADGASSTENYPNAFAHDGSDTLWYYADADGVLWTLEAPNTLTEYDELAGGTLAAGAAYLETDNGDYHFIPQGGSEVMTADVTVGNSGETPTTTTLTNVEGISNISLGDIAIDAEAGLMFISAVDSNNDGVFVRIDLSDFSQEVLVSDVPDAPSSDTAAGKQIAFGLSEDSEKQLYAHEAAGAEATGTWYQVDTGDGSVLQVDETETFTDLAQCGPDQAV